MISILKLIFLTIVITEVSPARENKNFIDTFNPFLRIAKVGIGRALERTTRTKTSRKILEEKNKAVKEVPLTTPFPCDLSGTLKSDKVPTDAHHVRPGDIDVIGAMGDSLTAGFAISTSHLLQLLFVEERGRSFSIGGEKSWRQYLTLPNILKMYNPKLIGYSLGAAQSFEWGAQFNVAESGAISDNMPFMARELVKRIKRDPRVDLKNHWKMITIFIGHNDFCSEVCYAKSSNILRSHKEDMLQVLRYLRDNLPRTIVNIIPPLKINELKDFGGPFECYLFTNFVCPCIVGLQFKRRLEQTIKVMKKWQQIDIEISNLSEFDLDDFTVIPHLFTTNYTVPKTPDGKLDLGLLAPDCFHFSERTHERTANNLWNSLLEPQWNKSKDGDDAYKRFLCPTKDKPFIYTRRNSL